MPLQRSHPYGDDYGKGPIALPVPVKDVVFCFEVVRIGDVTVTLQLGEQITLPDLATTAIQQLLCSPPAKLT